MSDSREKRMVADTGYKVIHALRIGDREILLAENPDEPDGKFYLKAEYRDNGLIGEYSRMISGPSYLGIMDEFIGAIGQKIAILRQEFEKADYQAKPIAAAECVPHDYGQDLNGKVVAIKAGALRPEYRRGDVQAVLVPGGFGASANSRGSAVYCQHPASGEQARFERRDILGEIKELPEWAKERLAEIRAGREAEKKPEPETNAGYTITERATVGKTLFVLGERPDGNCVTWQRYEGRECYDHGHYFESRAKAAADLQRRADRERDALENKTRNPRSRDDAR